MTSALSSHSLFDLLPWVQSFAQYMWMLGIFGVIIDILELLLYAWYYCICLLVLSANCLNKLNKHYFWPFYPDFKYCSQELCRSCITESAGVFVCITAQIWDSFIAKYRIYASSSWSRNERRILISMLSVSQIRKRAAVLCWHMYMVYLRQHTVTINILCAAQLLLAMGKWFKPKKYVTWEMRSYSHLCWNASWATCLGTA